jgi:type I restriction enzyme R subunit
MVTTVTNYQIDTTGLTPEEQARFIGIDKRLNEAGWVIQNFKDMNPKASLGVAVREFRTNVGEVDYALFVDGKLCGIIEAKPDFVGQNITTVEDQNAGYVNGGSKYGDIENNGRFIYEATGVLTRFTDYLDIEFRSREVFSFHQPIELQRLLSEVKTSDDNDDTLRNRLKTDMPELDSAGFRKCQIVAINNLEQSFSENKPKALVQMATGSGKTYTAISEVYRLLKFANAKRVLFLVDTKQLGKQANQEFSAFIPKDDPRTFPELYQVSHLKTSVIPQDAKVCISTIQRMYSILKGEELEESDEENPLTDKSTDTVKDVIYNSEYPPEFFDFIIIDECHRSIYNVWQQVLHYFDAFQIGFTATPDTRTFAYFNQNVVSEYTHEQAVIDGVNVQGEIFRIKTKITEDGAIIESSEPLVKKRERKTRKERWEDNEDEIEYSGQQLDRNVVNKSQIRTVLQCYKDKLPSLFVGRYPNDKGEAAPKTLIFAKDDSHADDIVQICREVFGKGNEFCKKITYRTEENADSLLSDFRNAMNPRIAVTVNMIATGTDVKPLESLIFMRDVKSKNYFEQMMGRGTRTQSLENLKTVSPTALHDKDQFVLVDAVGVTESDKLDTRPLNRNPSESLKDLMTKIVTGSRDEDTLTTLAGRFASLFQVLTLGEQSEIKKLGNGVTLSETTDKLLKSFDRDFLGETFENDRSKVDEYIEEAVAPIYNPGFREFILKARKDHDQIIDTVNIDEVTSAEWKSNTIEQSNDLIEKFESFVDFHKNEIEALEIIYNQSYKDRPLLLGAVEDLHNELLENNINETNIWNAYFTIGKTKNKPVNVKLADLVQLVKFAYGQIDELTNYESAVRSKYRDWLFSKGSGYEMSNPAVSKWFELIRDFVATNINVSKDDLSEGVFAENGGLMGFYDQFGDNYENVVDELNYALAA